MATIPLPKIFVFRDEHGPDCARMVPDGSVLGISHPQLLEMLCHVPGLAQRFHQGGRQLGVDQETYG